MCRLNHFGDAETQLSLYPSPAPTAMAESHQSKESITQEEYAVGSYDSAGRPAIEWDIREEEVIKQKMDFRLVPVVFLLYLLCFIDR